MTGGGWSLVISGIRCAVDIVNGRLSINRDSMFPFLPIAGIRLEF